MSVLPGVYILEPILSNCTMKTVVSAKIPQFLYSMANITIHYCCLFSGWGIWIKNQSFMLQTWIQPWFACWLIEKCAFTFFKWWDFSLVDDKMDKSIHTYTVVTMVHICMNNRFKFITLCIVAGKSLPPCEVFHRKLGTLASAVLFFLEITIVSNGSVQLACFLNQTEPSGGLLWTLLSFCSFYMVPACIVS